MNKRKAGSFDEPQKYIAVLTLVVSGTIKECVVLRVADHEEEGAYLKARQICHVITANPPEDCMPSDCPNYPYWNVLTVQKEHGRDGIVDLCLEDDIAKLDWLANVLGVSRCTEYWTKASQGEIVA